MDLLLEYVERTHGADTAQLLTRMRRGGDVNQKGANYELLYAVAKICDLAATESNTDDFLISAQEPAFVDDLCVRQVSTDTKTNYQAKNSSGAAADWTLEIEGKFRLQLNIDTKFYNHNSSKQILLVSCPNKANENKGKIPNELQSSCFSEFFPYARSVSELILSSPELRQKMQLLCDSNELSTLDTAFRIVISSWSGDDTIQQRSVSELMNLARSISRPDIFKAATIRPSAPDWLIQKCRAFQDVEVSVQSGRFMIQGMGMEVSLEADVVAPDQATLDALTTPLGFFMHLISMARI